MLVIGCWKKCITAAPETVSSSAYKSGLQGNHQGIQKIGVAAALSGWWTAHEGSGAQPHPRPALLVIQVPGQQLLCHALVLGSTAGMQGVPGLALLHLPAAAPLQHCCRQGRQGWLYYKCHPQKRDEGSAAAAAVKPLALAVRAELDRATSATFWAFLKT